MASGNAFNDFSRKHIPVLDSFMRSFFREKRKGAKEKFIRRFYGELEEYCLREGKKIRPLIILLSCMGYSPGAVKGERMKSLVAAASAVEIMHSFLLVQDDIIDKSGIRRGQKTLHILERERYSSMTKNPDIGSDVALILADVLLCNAVELLTRARLEPAVLNRFLLLFSETYELTAWGQILDSLHSLSVTDPRKGEARRIGIYKTANYTIYYPMLMGLALSGRFGNREKDRIQAFSIPLGLSFQIRDDVLGTLGREDKIGKSSDSDILEGKLTTLVEFALGDLGPEERKSFLSVYSKPEKSQGDVKFIRTKILETRAREKCLKEIRRLGLLSRKKISSLGLAGEQKDIFIDLIDLITDVSPEDV